MSKTTNKQMERMVRAIVAESERGDGECRKHGRPRCGRAIFQQVRIDALPESGRQSDVAHALGIRLASVQQWCLLKVNSLPYTLDDSGRKMLSKEDVVEWLIATRRYKPKREYLGDETTAAPKRRKKAKKKLERSFS